MTVVNKADSPTIQHKPLYPDVCPFCGRQQSCKNHYPQLKCCYWCTKRYECETKNFTSCRGFDVYSHCRDWWEIVPPKEEWQERAQNSRNMQKVHEGKLIRERAQSAYQSIKNQSQQVRSSPGATQPIASNNKIPFVKRRNDTYIPYACSICGIQKKRNCDKSDYSQCCHWCLYKSLCEKEMFQECRGFLEPTFWKQQNRKNMVPIANPPIPIEVGTIVNQERVRSKGYIIKNGYWVHPLERESNTNLSSQQVQVSQEMIRLKLLALTNKIYRDNIGSLVKILRYACLNSCNAKLIVPEQNTVFDTLILSKKNKLETSQIGCVMLEEVSTIQLECFRTASTRVKETAIRLESNVANFSGGVTKLCEAVTALEDHVTDLEHSISRLKDSDSSSEGLMAQIKSVDLAAEHSHLVARIRTNACQVRDYLLKYYIAYRERIR